MVGLSLALSDRTKQELIESFRFEDEYEYEFLRMFSNKKTPRKASFYFFSSKKLLRLLKLKEVKPSPDKKKW